MEDIIQIQLQFEKNGYRDTLYFPLDVYEKLSSDDIEKAKDKRIADALESKQLVAAAPEPEMVEINLAEAIEILRFQNYLIKN